MSVFPRVKDLSEQESYHIVSQLDTSETIGLVSGGYLSKSPACVGAIGAIERLGFEGICFADGPSGYTRSDGTFVRTYGPPFSRRACLGCVESDWYATHETTSFANAGLDVEMPRNISSLAGLACFGDLLLEAVNNGTVSKARLIDMAETPHALLCVASRQKLSVFGTRQRSHHVDLSIRPWLPPCRLLIGKAGVAGTVLLKNWNGVLPLKKQKQFGIFGDDASYPAIGSVYLSTGKHPEDFEMGTLDIGGGKDSGIVPKHHCHNNENVTAILSAHYPGEQLGNSIVDVLWGAVEPSGRLPYSIPKKQSDYRPPLANLIEPVTSSDAWNADFDEGQMINYRHFEAEGIAPLYKFRFRLPHIKFKMGSHLGINVESRLSSFADESKGIALGGLKDL
ncbi:glycoside hydrolase family 3 C-terminal domain-containing protein [Dactylonectria estremocensis]|uniref:beta-glucosidase n=1 Tax=Dactylonectria estremocensis TaxID=1079267 RepID=A0A9P9EWB1_9HYPO|nr:glycoside hydrolase family 3 C-terminal domain-containing protein [Dactylonectria estremocensis]